MGKREDNKLAKNLNKEIIHKIKLQLKGSGWQKKHNSFFQQIDDYFLCASAQPCFEFKNSIPIIKLNGRYIAKPMGIDLIYWDISQLSANKKEPLSFRAWAAFKASPAFFHFNTEIVGDQQNSEMIASYFYEWINNETKHTLDTLKKTCFSEIYLKLNPNASTHYNLAITLICTFILEEQNEKALMIAKNMAPQAFRNLFYEHPNNRVNFYELTILYLSGITAFKKEVLKNSGLAI